MAKITVHTVNLSVADGIDVVFLERLEASGGSVPSCGTRTDKSDPADYREARASDSQGRTPPSEESPAQVSGDDG
jgi:hypothetical protein